MLCPGAFLVLVCPGAVLAAMGFMTFVKGHFKISRASALEGATARLAGAVVCALGLLILYLAWTHDPLSRMLFGCFPIR